MNQSRRRQQKHIDKISEAQSEIEVWRGLLGLFRPRSCSEVHGNSPLETAQLLHKHAEQGEWVVPELVRLGLIAVKEDDEKQRTLVLDECDRVRREFVTRAKLPATLERQLFEAFTKATSATLQSTLYKIVDLAEKASLTPAQTNQLPKLILKSVLFLKGFRE